MQPVVDSIHELLVGVEALGSQPDLHLGEEIVVVWRQVRIVRSGRKSPKLKSLGKTFARAAVWGPCVVVQENDAFSEQPAPFFFLIKLRSLFSVSQ